MNLYGVKFIRKDGKYVTLHTRSFCTPFVTSNLGRAKGELTFRLSCGWYERYHCNEIVQGHVVNFTTGKIVHTVEV